MNIDIQWDRPHSNALLCCFTKDWTWYECREAMQLVSYEQENAGGPVACIFDLTSSTLPPRIALNHLQKLLSLNLKPNPKRVVIVDKTYRVGTFEAMLAHITSTMDHIYFEDDIWRARRLI